MSSGGLTSADSSGSSFGTGENFCGAPGFPCCEDTCYEAGSACIAGMCWHQAQLGGACTQNEGCTSNICLESGFCSKPCADAAECPPAPEWTCGPLANHPSDMCQCAPSGAEVCDGRDNDCNSVVDDGVTCPGAGFVCQSGACVCAPGNLCNDGCQDLAVDLQNCGACGNTCEAGASCFEGHCEITLVSGQDPIDFAVDATHIYWANKDTDYSQSMRKMPVAGGAVTTLASGQLNTIQLTLDASYVYWTGGINSDVMKVPLGGGAVTTLASGQEFPIGIAVDAARVYWASKTNPGTVRSMPLGGGAITISSSGQPGLVWSIALDATSMYMVSEGSILTKVPLTGGTPVELAPSDGKGQGYNYVAVDATHVYWTTDDAVMKVPVGGGAPIILASNQQSSAGIVVDATNVYWTSGSNVSDVLKMPLNGGTPTRIASGQVAVRTLAADATHVYWSANGSLKKAPK
jgi:hypothetical protein